MTGPAADGPERWRRLLLAVAISAAVLVVTRISLAFLQEQGLLSSFAEDLLALIVAGVIAVPLAVALWRGPRTPALRWPMLFVLGTMLLNRVFDLTDEVPALDSYPLIGADSVFHSPARDFLGAGAFIGLGVAVFVLAADQRRHHERVLDELARGTASLVGKDFHAGFVGAVARALRVRYAFVAVQHGDDSIRTIAFWRGNRLAENFTCPVRGSPCEVTFAGEAPVLYPSGLREAFPRDQVLEGLDAEAYYGIPLFDSREELLGQVCLVHDEMIELSVEDLSTLRVFASRSAAELERQRTEDSLHGTNAILSAILEGTPDALFAKDLDGRYLSINTAGAELVGKAPDEILGRDDRALFQPEHADRVMGFDDQVMAAKTTITIEETLAAGDQTRTYRTTKGPYLGDGGEVLGLVGIARDITEEKRAAEDRRRMETRLQQAQKVESLSALSGAIAHDFNNLLTVIHGHASVLESAGDSRSAIREHVLAIQTAGSRAGELSRQLEVFAGGVRSAPESFQLPDLLRELVPLLEVSISRNAVLRLELGEDLPPVEGDVNQIRQVMINVVTNASEALLGNSGTIAVRTGVVTADRAFLSAGYGGEELSEGEYVYIEIADTGAGMDGDTRARIFDPFFSTRLTGRGLGLAASLAIVRAHRGTIVVDSEPGDGTKVAVLLPASQRPRPNDSQGDGAAEDRRTTRGTILLVDDEPITLNAIRRVLESTHSVVLSGDGLEAVEIFRKRPQEISAVLIEMKVPRMGGAAAFTALRRIRADIPVLLMSRGGAEETVQDLLAQGRVGFIEKPFNPDELIHQLRRLQLRSG